jgi:hypothetical protein
MHAPRNPLTSEVASRDDRGGYVIWHVAHYLGHMAHSRRNAGRHAYSPPQHESIEWALYESADSEGVRSNHGRAGPLPRNGLPVRYSAIVERRQRLGLITTPCLART